jgi:hypothetical protein
MKHVTLSLPSFAFIVGTRAVLGVGLGLLAARRVPENKRRRVGAALLAVGAATTVPSIMTVVRGRRRAARARRTAASRDPRLIGATRFPRRGNEIEADTVW